MHFNQDAHVTWHKKWAEKNAEMRTQVGSDLDNVHLGGTRGGKRGHNVHLTD
jgi:hypothetical protein